jgi:hypothetical protein
MARKLRIQYPGAIYHVMNRGDRREPIFQDDFDRERFLETLGEVWQDRLAGIGVLFDVESFSSGRGNTDAKPRGGHEVAPRHLHSAVQPAA